MTNTEAYLDDCEMANFLGIPVEDLVNLREGTTNPTPRLIKAFKEKMIPLGVSEESINEYLVEPF